MLELLGAVRRFPLLEVPGRATRRLTTRVAKKAAHRLKSNTRPGLVRTKPQQDPAFTTFAIPHFAAGHQKYVERASMTGLQRRTHAEPNGFDLFCDSVF